MGKKILIVEDEPDQIMMLQTRLEASGFEVHSASDGAAGLERVPELKPDLILLDLAIPKVGGLEVCRRLKGDPQTRGIPVVILTASGVREVEKQCKEAGANACMRKPFESQELVATIQKLLLNA